MADSASPLSSCQLRVEPQDHYFSAQLPSAGLQFERRGSETAAILHLTDIVARYKDATGTKSLLVPGLTPVVVTGAGPNWLKVSLREGGVDVPFITDPSHYNALYRLATEVEGSREFKKISELPEKVP